MDSLRILTGKPLEEGTFVTSKGVNFSVFSRNATKIFLELFEKEDSDKPYQTIELDSEKNRTGDIWHVFVEGLKPGALYLYRADGPYNPSHGHRFDATKYLFDPKAKSFSNGSVFKNMKPGLKIDMKSFPKNVVIDDSDFDWENDRQLNIPLNNTIIYETHLKGFTASPSSKVEHPGTYLGFTEKIPYLQKLGITAVEFLPLMEFDDYENGNTNPMTGTRLTNYWGYSTIGYFAPKTSFAFDKTPGGAVKEFKYMVKKLHEAGIEVILDVVFNHTAEGNENGVTLNFRGFDNSIFYHLVNDHKEYYMNFSGCGNAVNANHPVVSDFIINCLRYWVLEMHVDGFRFDLASELTRDEKGFPQGNSPLTTRISEDPVLRSTKIIAEGLRWRIPNRRISGRNFEPLVRMERPLQGRNQKIHPRRRKPCDRGGNENFRLVRLVLDFGTQPDEFNQFHNLARRIHAQRPRFVQQQAQRAERRGKQGRQRQQQQLQLRIRRNRPESENQQNQMPAGAEFPHDASRLTGNADDCFGRRSYEDAERKQQLVLPGQRDLMVQLGKRGKQRQDSRIHAEAYRNAKKASCFPAEQIFRRSLVSEIRQSS